MELWPKKRDAGHFAKILKRTMFFVLFLSCISYIRSNIKVECTSRKIYIDGGANLANSLFMIEEATNAPTIGSWEVFAFEASEELAVYTNVVAWHLNNGKSLTEARKVVHWNDTVDGCVRKCYTEAQPFEQCEALVADWHHQVIEPLIHDSPSKISRSSPILDGCGVAKGRHTFNVLNYAMCGNREEQLPFQFSLSNYVNGGSNGMRINTHSGKYREYSVPCIRLAKWIIQNFKTTDYIVLKLDIEGAEYSVINDLLYTGGLQYIDEIFVEWHSRFAEVSKFGQFEEAIRWIAESHDIAYHTHG